MSQNDFVIANGSGATVRNDMNSAFQALASSSAAPTAPATTYQYQYWFDTTLNIQKQRNGANTAWVNLWSLVGSTLKLYEQGVLLLARANTWTAAQIVERLYTAGAADPGADKIDALGIGTNLAATEAAMEAASAVDKVVTPGRAHHHPGAAKVWANFTIAGVVDGSYNVTSITDNGSGDWTVNIDTDFASVNYAPFANVDPVAVGDNLSIGAVSPAVGSYGVIIEASGGSAADPGAGNIHTVAFGEQ